MVPTSRVNLADMERVTLGTPAAEAVARLAEQRGAERVFILAGTTLNRNTDEIRRIETALGRRHAATHDGVRAHSPRGDVLAAAKVARECDADLVVTVGGGSVTDAGKAIPLCLRHDIAAHDDFDAYRNRVSEDGTGFHPAFEGPDVRVIAVPTTLSGGEFNSLAGVTDELTRLKQGYEHRRMAPAAVVLDPAITVHTPEWVWLSTGVRAVDHCAETLGSLRSNAFCDGMAESGLRLLAGGLALSKSEPGDLEARLNCQVGAWQSMIPVVGGVALGASHAIGHVLGGTCDVPHGYTSCVMAPFVQAWNAPANAARQRRISGALGDAERPAAGLLDALIHALGMPRSLAEVGIGEEQLPLIAANTLQDYWSRTNPRPIDGVADVLEILRSALC
jgi:alcohol dehydrogenase class IV